MVTRGKENQIGNLLQENNLSLFARKLLNWLHLAGLLTFPDSNSFPSFETDSGFLFKPAAISGSQGITATGIVLDLHQIPFKSLENQICCKYNIKNESLLFCAPDECYF